MAGEPTVSISVTVWETKLALYMASTGKNIREALYEEWPLLMRKIMDFTPPFKSGGGRGQSDLSIGRAAASRDIRKTMRPFYPEGKSISARVAKAANTTFVAGKRVTIGGDSGGFYGSPLEKAAQRKDIALFNLIASRVKSGPMAGAKAVAFSPEVHTSQRNRRGRVERKASNTVVLGNDNALLLKYIKQVQGRVGYAKSGWLKALLLVGGSAPDYVNNKGTSGGDVIDDHANEDNPSITAINRTPWAVRKDEASRIMSDAHASRAQAIVNKVKAMERLAREQSGLAA